MKTCTRCRTEKPTSEFSRNRRRRDGLDPWCKLCVRQNVRRWRQRNPEHRRALSRAERQRWRARFPFRQRAEIANYRARVVYLVPGTLTAADVRDALEATSGHCTYCGCELGPSFEIDHRVPMAAGGPNTRENITVACRRCNARKDSPMAAARRWGAG